MTPRPRFADAWDDLRRLVEHILSEREAAYPALIEAGKLDADEAAQRLGVMRAIVADWRFVTTLTGAPGDEVPDAAKQAELETIAARAAERAKRHLEHGDLAEAAAALLWHQSRVYGPVWCARTTLAARAWLHPTDERKAA